MNEISGHIKIKLFGKYRNVWVSDINNCKNYKCFKPHDCPVHGARGVNSSCGRWMCLTNFYNGCPDRSGLSNIKLNSDVPNSDASF